jgi:hypothetical protein
MGKRLCTLESIQSVTSPQEEQFVAQVAPIVQELADNTTDAINHLNAHEGSLWTSTYKTNIYNMYTEAREISHAINQNEHMTRLREREARLQSTDCGRNCEQELDGK